MPRARMSEFRRDPITGRWRVVAEGRSARPDEYRAPSSYRSADAEDCPFCEGREGRTPPEIAAVRPNGSVADAPGWTVRSIPNRFPTVDGVGTEGATAGSGMFQRAAGAGLHEVIVTSPAHAPGLPHFTSSHLRELFRFFRVRVRDLAARPSIRSVLLFENAGPESGGTLLHPHVQLVATETIPFRLIEELEGFRRIADSGPSDCGLESVVASEARAAERIVANDERFAVLAPFASEHPYEIWIIPHRHASTFAAASGGEVERLAELLPAVLRALDRVRPGASYNWYIHGLEPPPGTGSGFHWHVEIAPRLLRVDGYELGAGTPVNPVPPERATAELRAQLEKERSSAPQKR